MVVKQLIFDEQTGRLILSDDNNNHYLCDIYGRKNISFLPDITGVCNYHERDKMTKNSLDSVEKPTDHFPREKSKLYLPSTRKYEGYFPFPSPLSPPFSNVPKFQLSERNRSKLINILTKHFHSDKVLRVFAINKSENKGVSYLTHPINPNDNSKSDRDDLLNLIERHFDEYRVLNKYKLNLMPKDPVIKALKKLKKFLLENEDIKVMNGRNLPSPSDCIINKFKAIDRQMKSKSLMRMKNKQREDIIESEVFIKNIKRVKVNEDLSCLSIESENERKYIEENINLKNSLKDTNFLAKSLDRERRFVEGFKENPIKDKGIIRKIVKTKFKSNGDNYDENMALLKRVNPIAFELRKKKEDYDTKQLVKKRNQKFIFEKNVGF